MKDVKGLESLELWSTKVTDAGVAQLKELKGLQKLNLMGTKVTDSGVAELKKALPGCKISS